MLFTFSSKGRLYYLYYTKNNNKINPVEENIVILH